MEQMRKLPIGIQTFEKLREENYLYVDKTAMVYKIASNSTPYFLSRPRRFGKSLLISTFEAYFQGRKDLFHGLAIEKLETQWEEYPVLHLDLNARNYEDKNSLLEELNKNLEIWEQIYNSPYADRAPEERFYHLIRLAYEQAGQRVAILVDEYDKPMLQAIGNEELQKQFREVLKPFYGVLKTLDGCIKFAMLTGVTKFGKVSVCSDLNNLDDISMRNEYVEICGVSEREIHDTLEAELHEFAEAQELTYEALGSRLKEYYDGYHFTHNSIGVYNPFSLLNAFKYKEINNYWFETGTPTYLVELLKRNHYDLGRMAHVETDADVLNSIYGDEDPIPVIFQSGYLTIKGYDKEFGLYRLGFPNKEVEEGFMKFLIPFYTHFNKVEAPFEIQRFVKELRAGDIDAFFKRLRSFFADTPYELVSELELHYQNVLFILYKLLGFYVKAERHTSDGRIDLVLQTDKFIYIIEFKLDGTAEEALQQINEKRYALPFEQDARRLFKIGVNFSNTTRNIEKWLVEE